MVCEETTVNQLLCYITAHLSHWSLLIAAHRWIRQCLVGVIACFMRRPRCHSTAHHVLCRRCKATATSGRWRTTATAWPIRTRRHCGRCCCATTGPLVGRSSWCSVGVLLRRRVSCAVPAMITCCHTRRLIWWISSHSFSIWIFNSCHLHNNIHNRYTQQSKCFTATHSILGTISNSVRHMSLIRKMHQLAGSIHFLLLTHYVPNVAKRSIWDQCKKKYILRTDRLPTDDRPLIWENFKWPYLREAWSDPLHIWFYGGVFGVGRSNGAISSLTKLNRYVGKTMHDE